MPIYAGKICNIRTLLKYAGKMRQHAKYAAIAYSRRTGMRNWPTSRYTVNQCGAGSASNWTPTASRRTQESGRGDVHVASTCCLGFKWPPRSSTVTLSNDKLNDADSKLCRTTSVSQLVVRDSTHLTVLSFRHSLNIEHRQNFLDRAAFRRCALLLPTRRT